MFIMLDVTLVKQKFVWNKMATEIKEWIKEWIKAYPQASVPGMQGAETYKGPHRQHSHANTPFQPHSRRHRGSGVVVVERLERSLLFLFSRVERRSSSCFSCFSSFLL